jgi:hypothetical protein
MMMDQGAIEGAMDGAIDGAGNNRRSDGWRKRCIAGVSMTLTSSGHFPNLRQSTQ